MKKLIIIMSMLCLALLSAAPLEHYQDNGFGVGLSLRAVREMPFSAELREPGDEEFPETPLMLRTLAFPYQEAELEINYMTWRVFNREGEYLTTRSELRESALELVSPFTFREMRGVSLKILTQVETADEILTLSDLDVQIRGSGTITLPESISPAFAPAYKELADNWDGSYLSSLPLARPKMLIISHANLTNYQAEFIHWKRSLGFDVEVINKVDAGSSANEIRQTIRNYYLEHRPDYLLLMGDTVGNFSIPTFRYPSPEYNEMDADDQTYVLIEGDDYFPEMLVGRFSFAEIMQVANMLSKSVGYERNPYMVNTAWMKRALMVAGNYAEGSLRPTTPVWMSRWLRTKLLDYGYAQVDTVYYPGQFPGTSQITQSINNGVQFISYRGWGDANGWHYPYFHNENVNETNNGAMMPIVFSIVCNTGDFDNANVNPCFGENWMRRGTSANPGGCVAFVGPSDLHTKTRLNNSISSGAFRSIFDLGVRTFGTSVLMGKIELYKNFPQEIGMDQYVPFYFHVYNLLSDPSLNMWVLVPDRIEESVIAEGLNFSHSQSHIRIRAPHLEGGMVSGTKNNVDFSYAFIKNGEANLPVDTSIQSPLRLTVSKENYVPLSKTLIPNADAQIGVSANTAFETQLEAGETVQIAITLKNFTESAFSGVTAELVQHERIQCEALNPAAFDLAAGAEHTLSFALTGEPNLRPGETINLRLVTQNPAYEYRFGIEVGGATFMIVDYEGIIALGGTSEITLTGMNFGTSGLSGAKVTAFSKSDAALADAQVIELGDIAAGESFSFNASITTMADIYNGRSLPMRFVFSSDEGYSYTANYALTAGTPGLSDPTGPCEYGYFAYDNGDVDFEMAPVYDWVELDPLLGGEGEVWEIMDDGVLRVPLPFTFGFYGVDYDAITISSNGWASFVHTNDSYFNNHYIPAALGPQALIAPYWDDLKGMKIGYNDSGEALFDDMRVLYWHDAANGRFIVQWNDAYNQYTIDAGENASLEKFQFMLYPKLGGDGDIVVQYHTVDNPSITGNYATVGLMDTTHLMGLTYTYGNIYPATASPLAPGLAIRFTTTAPDSYVSTQDLVNEAMIAKLYNYPNPFNPETTISFESKANTEAELSIYNMKGQLVRSLHKGAVAKGQNSFVWDGKDNLGSAVASGLYLYQIKSDGVSYSRKMLLMK
ncbi:MAG: T9SS type A sorting domain-containing protein [Candidatus Cloacimonetes bacterium]|nr:T9SS type A sorting domain-containing protein [Candidatus Cloacimonadota bacterium]